MPDRLTDEMILNALEKISKGPSFAEQAQSQDPLSPPGPSVLAVRGLSTTTDFINSRLESGGIQGKVLIFTDNAWLNHN